jgi:hypothetical protein
LAHGSTRPRFAIAWEKYTNRHACYRSAYAKKIVASFKDWEFFTGESMNPDGMIVLLNYREDGVTPYVVVWKHGLSEMKV